MDDLVKRLRATCSCNIDNTPCLAEEECRVAQEAADRIEELEAENKLLNEQMDAIEEMGTESLNALPDCLMRLAPALVENGELKVKMEKAAAFIDFLDENYRHVWGTTARSKMRTTLAELKGENDE